jgi:hypothetical protein
MDPQNILPYVTSFENKLLIPQHILIGFPYSGNYAKFEISDKYSSSKPCELKQGDIAVLCCSTDPYVLKSLQDAMHKTQTANPKDKKNIFNLENKLIITADFEDLVNNVNNIHNQSQQNKRLLVPQYQLGELKESADSFFTILIRLTTYGVAFQKMYAEQQTELQTTLTNLQKAEPNQAILSLQQSSPQTLNHLLEMAIQLELYEQCDLINKARKTKIREHTFTPRIIDKLFQPQNPN